MNPTSSPPPVRPADEPREPTMRSRREIATQLYHYRESLDAWRSGYLAPTEPDEGERRLTMDRLKVGIAVLEWVLGGELR